MRGVSYLVDEKGKKTTVLIDLKSWGRFWEDFQDVMVSESRKDEPTVDWEDLKSEMERTNG